MISQIAFNGGCTWRGSATPVTLTWADTRLQVWLKTVSAAEVTLPDAELLKDDGTAIWLHKQGAYFVVFNLTGANRDVRVKYNIGASPTTLVTITPGTYAKCILVRAVNGNEYWVAKLRSINAVRAGAHGSRATIAIPAVASSYNPFCPVGDDCVWSGPQPLNGQGGRSMVVAPFFQNPVATALNQYREPIRAADVVMPDRIVLRLAKHSFIKDSLCAKAGVTLSQRFYDALEDGNPILLTYDAQINGTSRNPYHMRRAGASAAAGAFTITSLSVTRHRWKFDKPYTDPLTNKTYNIWYRLHMEHTCGDPVWLPIAATINRTDISQTAATKKMTTVGGNFLTQGFLVGHKINISGFTGGGFNGIAFIKTVSATEMTCECPSAFVDDAIGESVTITAQVGGTNNASNGSWGQLSYVAIFAEEIDPAWIEGGNFTPTGASAAIAFTRDDPIVSGKLAGGGALDPKDKFCHPQLVALAMLPTTWHSPFGYDYIPWTERQYADPWDTQRGRNRSWCYKRPNRAPWGNPTLANYPPFTFEQGLFFNTIFGWDAAAVYTAASMTTGGDFPRSGFTEWLCWENGRGEGRTYFKVFVPGWDENEGYLTVSSGNAGSIRICTTKESWSRYEPGVCAGHPVEPFMAVGGSHRCMNNNGTSTSTKCCWTIGPTIEAAAICRQPCTLTVSSYGDPIPGSNQCNLISSVCQHTGTYITSKQLFIGDYTFSANANQDLRQMTWSRFIQDPTAVIYDYAYVSTDVSLFVAESGSLPAFGAQITHTGGSPKNVTLWEPPTQIKDGSIQAVLKNASTSSGALIFRGIMSVGDQLSGITIDCTTNKSDPIELTIKFSKWVVDTETVLFTHVITDFVDSDMTLRILAWGTHWEFSATPVIGTAVTYTTDTGDCAIDSGYPGMYAKVSQIPVWDLFTVDDQTPTLLEIVGHCGKSTVDITFPTQVTAGYGLCSTTFNPTCPTCCASGVHCNCVTWTQALTSTLTTSASYGRDILPAVYTVGVGCTDGDNPTYCGGPHPHCCVDRICADGMCATCPPTTELLTFCIPTRCRDAGMGVEPLLCGGVSKWSWIDVACA